MRNRTRRCSNSHFDPIPVDEMRIARVPLENMGGFVVKCRPQPAFHRNRHAAYGANVPNFEVSCQPRIDCRRSCSQSSRRPFFHGYRNHLDLQVNLSRASQEGSSHWAAASRDVARRADRADRSPNARAAVKPERSWAISSPPPVSVGRHSTYNGALVRYSCFSLGTAGT